MFNKGDIAYFVFRGDWATKCYKGQYCLCRSYFPFMPVTIMSNSRNREHGLLYNTGLFKDRENIWNIHEGCLEKEFSFGRFIIAQLAWKKRVSAKQFQQIISTVE